jgi:multicomponent Na+:H+ antiporter subunit D
VTDLVWLASAPVLLPLVTLAVTAALAHRPRAQATTSRLGTLALLACAVALVGIAAGGETLVVRFGNWPAPFAIEFRVDRLAAVMIAAVALLTSLVLTMPMRGAGLAAPWLQPLVQGLLAGVGGVCVTADLFNLYVWFEVMLISALGLIVLGRQPQHLEAGFKYLVLNLVGTLLLLVAVAALYGATGQLNYAAIGAALGSNPTARADALVVLLLLSLLTKTAAFPFLAWLPASYPALGAPVLALFSGLVTKAGAFAVLRITAEIYPAGTATLLPGLGWLAALTMMVGVMGAAYHYDTRRILAFHSVSQIGYILLGIALGTTLGITAAMFFILHHAFVKATLFIIGGLAARHTGSHDLRRSGGLWTSQPALAALFALSAAALVGLPPLSGFWAKLLVIRASFGAGQYAWGGMALAVGGLTLYSMIKVWIEAFWKPHPAGTSPPTAPLAWTTWASAIGLTAVALAMGLAPEPLIEYLQAGAMVPARTAP